MNTETNFVLLNLNENEEIRTWDSLTKKPRVHEFEFNLEDGFIGRVRIYSPIEWHPAIKNCRKKYKLLLHVDGRPEGQIVTAKYQISWLWELILNKNFIVVEVKFFTTFLILYFIFICIQLLKKEKSLKINFKMKVSF